MSYIVEFFFFSFLAKLTWLLLIPALNKPGHDNRNLLYKLSDFPKMSVANTWSEWINKYKNSRRGFA